MKEFPPGHVHGHNEIPPHRSMELAGKAAGDASRYRSTAAAFSVRGTSHCLHRRHRRVEYRQVGTSILMENDRGQTRSFLVTRSDDETLTVDGNNPLCGRAVVFRLRILTVRDATDAETKAGGAIGAGPDIDPAIMRPV
jgi:FKBP-type peptidyl-prolyl cis-trans isomerase SlyD